MRKNSTLYSNSPHKKKIEQKQKKMIPSDKTINKILQFAASYRVEKVPEDIFVDYYLN